MNLTEAILAVTAAFPYAAGWSVGIIARAGTWLRAAYVTGYRRGRYGSMD